jgi:cyclopropane fatty-acyl-phospholipid synthase-like methyltransferase
VGIDVSTTMVSLVQQRLRPWAERATVRLSDGSCRLLEGDASFDRVVSTYVLDLLSPNRIEAFLEEAFRVLTSDGLICLVSLGHGEGVLGRLVSSAWPRVP